MPTTYKPSEFEMILAAESRLRLPPLFYLELLNEKDDWSFVVKTHALFEGALIQSIRHVLKFPEVCKRANVQGWEGKTYPEKLRLALQLGVLEQDYYNFLEELGKLRNLAVHNLGFMALDLRRFSDGRCESSQSKKWINAMGAGWKDIPVATWCDAWRRACGRDRLVDEIARRGGAPEEFMHYMENMSLREFMVFLSPRAAIWYGGIWTLDLLSIWLHTRIEHGERQFESSLEPNIQDLLLDPVVLQFKRNVFRSMPDLPQDIQTKVICHEMVLAYAIRDFRSWDASAHGTSPPPTEG